ncbi:alcohol oxidase [Fomes fomentarius]|nr:alcohol oxidase [Fomes fomentarius]
MLRKFLRTTVLFVTFCCAVGEHSRCGSHASLEPGDFVKIKFDYLVVGGGTAGLALSARLAENSRLTVGVIEAGILHLNDPIVDVPSFSGVGNASYDWRFVTTPQVNAAGRNISIPRGKLLGGSSGINQMAWGRASSVEYDAWSQFARDSSWSWQGLLPYMKKAERFFEIPSNPYPGISREEAAHAHAALPLVDGFNGPIIASLNEQYSDVVPVFVDTLNHLGINTNPAPQAGNATGVTNSLLSIDRAHGVRSYSATGYFCPHANKTNYHVLSNAQATRILFSRPTHSGELTATGVVFVSGGKQYTASVKKEVILSAGSVQTPQLLELSGIGNRRVLESHGLSTLVELPGVGENLQEHLFVGVQWQLKHGVKTFDILRNNATFATEQAAQYAKNGTGLLADTDNTAAFIPFQHLVPRNRSQELLKMFDRQLSAQGLTKLHRQQYTIARKWLAEGSTATVEILEWSKGFVAPVHGESYAFVLGGIMHPLSRGSVHISSSDPLAPPTVDPAFLSNELDSQMLLDIVKFIQDIGRTPPLSNLVTLQTTPELSAQTNEELIGYIRATSAGGSHLIGTAAMSPREIGGVVDKFLKVYGTANLRVVDASIFPIQIACHSQATVYAVAEKAADMIAKGQ